MAYQLVKRFTNYYGLDLKSSDLTRNENFASGMSNAQYRKSGAIEKRPGYQGSATSLGRHGLFTYNRIDPVDGLETEEIINAGSTLYRLGENSLVISYVGADPTALISIFFDPDTDQYRCQILEGAVVVLDQALGQGYDEASVYTIDQLRAAIDALANFVATLIGPTSTPAAFIDTTRDWDLSATGDPLIAVARYWAIVNTTSTNPLAGSTTNENEFDFENVSFTQLQNVVFIANGYNETLKYDGQTVYRAGLPDVDTVTQALGGAGAITGTNYYHVAQYSFIDAVGNFIEGNTNQTDTGVNPVAQSINVTVANILAGTGFNTDCAIVAGAQVAVNTITVDDGSGGFHTMKAGDTAYFYDAVSIDYVERLVTAVAATTITVAGAAVTVADNAVISNNLRIAIYRNPTSAVTPSIFNLIVELPNNSFAATQVYNDNTPDAGLGAELVEPLTDRSPPPKGKYVSSFRNQLVIAGNILAPNSVYYSDIESPEYFPSDTNQFDVASLSGDKITGIGPNNEVFVIFQFRGIHIVQGNIADNQIRVDQISNDIGCVAHHTIKEFRGILAFLSEFGPRKMMGGQVPTGLGQSADNPLTSRIDPVFDTVGLTETEVFQLQRAVAIHHRGSDKYLLFLPAESLNGSDRYANEQSQLFAYDYSRDAWLQWDNMDLSGGVTILGDDLFWKERVYSAYSGLIRSILYRQHNLGDAYDYQDNLIPVDFSYASQWETLGEPSVLKSFNSIRIFSLEELQNNDLMVTVTTERNYIRDVTATEFSYSLGGAWYGVSEYGNAQYGDPSEGATARKLVGGRERAVRVIFSNNRDQENIVISGWELQIAPSYKAQFKK